MMTAKPLAQKRSPKNILVTGGAGFIGSNFIAFLSKHNLSQGNIVCFDKLTYAANPATLKDLKELPHLKFFHIQGDVCDQNSIERVIEHHEIDTIVHFAAESHVDRSILGPEAFIHTNIYGTFCLLEAVKKAHKNNKNIHLHHISTDEVYGSLGKTGKFSESTAYHPNSPYSASKASADHLVQAYHATYGLNTTLSNCSNNYGPYHFPEKLIPLLILNCLNQKPLPIYGQGLQIRDWLYVEDHVSAIWKILVQGNTGEKYNIGGNSEWQNIDLVNHLCERMAECTNKAPNHYKSLITFVQDRPGHDMRYAIDNSKISQELDWSPQYDFTKGLDATIQWYLKNPSWIEALKTEEYHQWISKQYGTTK